MSLPRLSIDGVELCDLQAFIAVAGHRSFTAAAAQLGFSLSSTSQRISALEARLGVRLFQRTTRTVSLTEAGARLLAEVEPLIKRLDDALRNAGSAGQTPAGLLRLAVAGPFAPRILAPLIQAFLSAHPEIRLEVRVEEARRDLLKSGCDASVRVGDQVERDMINLPVIGPYKMLAVAAPSYLTNRGLLQEPRDLLTLDCIAVRAPCDGALPPWTFARGDQRAELLIEGRVSANDPEVCLRFALDGLGVAYLPEPIIAAHLSRGELTNLLPHWGGERCGLFLYYPSRRPRSASLQALIDHLAASMRIGRCGSG
jgi:DNA-binding transcriptional LysR family regulator